MVINHLQVMGAHPPRRDWAKAAKRHPASPADSQANEQRIGMPRLLVLCKCWSPYSPWSWCHSLILTSQAWCLKLIFNSDVQKVQEFAFLLPANEKSTWSAICIHLYIQFFPFLLFPHWLAEFIKPPLCCAPYSAVFPARFFWPAGFEREIGTEMGERRSHEYNRSVRENCVRRRTSGRKFRVDISDMIKWSIVFFNVGTFFLSQHFLYESVDGIVVTHLSWPLILTVRCFVARWAMIDVLRNPKKDGQLLGFWEATDHIYRWITCI